MTIAMEPRTAAVDREALLVARLRAGDEAAYTEMVRLHHGALVRVAASHVRSHTLAEEVAQDTWLAVLNGIGRFEGRSSFRTWLFTIATNLAKTRGKREARCVPFSSLALEADDRDVPVEPSGFLADGHWAVSPAEWRDPEQRMDTSAALERVQSVIDGLPEAQRAVITLRDVQGLDSAEVCRLLELSEGNQRVLLHRARAKVRLALGELLGKS